MREYMLFNNIDSCIAHEEKGNDADQENYDSIMTADKEQASESRSDK